jgi:hypothetical protein
MLCSEAPLRPKAARRIAREAATQTFDKAADALNDDWGATFDGKQIERWACKFGARMEAERAREVADSECGRKPAPPVNAPNILLIGLDGARVQMREIDPESKSRWREDKVATITSYVPGDGADIEPQPLLTTHVATMETCEPFGRMARVEAERRGVNQAQQVIGIGDCGNWIDGVIEREFPGIPRIADWAHAAEHLHENARAVCGNNEIASEALAEEWTELLWNGEVEALIAVLQAQSEKAGKPRKNDGPQHPRRVLSRNVGYFENNKEHMNYPEYRGKGWPIGSGNTEAAAKQFNKRVKGTEQFWQPDGAEAILNLRAMWLSQDGRWQRYWSARPAYLKRAA